MHRHVGTRKSGRYEDRLGTRKGAGPARPSSDEATKPRQHQRTRNPTRTEHPPTSQRATGQPRPRPRPEGRESWRSGRTPEHHHRQPEASSQRSRRPGARTAAAEASRRGRGRANTGGARGGHERDEESAGARRGHSADEGDRARDQGSGEGPPGHSESGSAKHTGTQKGRTDERIRTGSAADGHTPAGQKRRRHHPTHKRRESGRERPRARKPSKSHSTPPKRTAANRARGRRPHRRPDAHGWETPHGPAPAHAGDHGDRHAQESQATGRTNHPQPGQRPTTAGHGDGQRRSAPDGAPSGERTPQRGPGSETSTRKPAQAKADDQTQAPTTTQAARRARPENRRERRRRPTSGRKAKEPQHTPKETSG